MYDESGILYGIKYNGLNYYYLRNIIGIIDFKNDIVVKYDYDAYGNIMNITRSGKSGIVKVNPFIYKGYYFDFETGLYLLTATSLGGKTIDMTWIGRHLTNMGYASNHPSWAIASTNFASQVSQYGSVHAVLYYPGMSETSAWLTSELPVLVKKFVEIIIGGL